MGKLDKGVNPSSLNKIYWSGPQLINGAKIGVVAGLVGLSVIPKLKNIYIYFNLIINFL